MIENYFFSHIPCKNLSPLLHASYILVRKKLEKRLCLTGTRGHPVIITKNTPKKGTKKAETLKFFEHFDYLLIGVTGFEPAASWSRTKRSTELSHTPMVCAKPLHWHVVYYTISDRTCQYALEEKIHKIFIADYLSDSYSWELKKI